MEYIWTPHIMAHSTIMWCGNGRETTCHCGWERDSRTEARPRARPALQFTFNRSLSLFISSLSFSSSSLPLSVSHRLSNSSCFFLVLSQCLSHFSRLLYFDPRVTASERMSCSGQGNIAVIL